MLLWLLVVLLNAPRFRIKAQFSAYERERLQGKGDPVAILEARRLEQNEYLHALQYVIVSLGTAGFSMVTISHNPNFWGVVAVAAGVLLLPVASGFKPVRRLADNVVDPVRVKLEEMVEPLKPYLSVWRNPDKDFVPAIRSKEELMSVVMGAEGIMSRAELSRLRASLKFDELRVVDVMTRRSDISAISQDEVLGPLVLDEMYKTGHSRFPVYDGDIDRIVGMLYLHDFAVGAVERSQTVKHAMHKSFMTVTEHKPLSGILSKFIKERQHLAIVTDKDGRTTGIISLEDVIEALIGEEIVDEFDKSE